MRWITDYALGTLIVLTHFFLMPLADRRALAWKESRALHTSP